MGLFGFFKASADEPAVMIDVSSGSVGGAYVSKVKGALTLHYSARVPIRAHEGEKVEVAAVRALTELTKLLIERGAPVLRRAIGPAQLGEVFVSVAAPWQESVVRRERVEKKEPFTVTRAVLAEAVRKSVAPAEGRVSTGEAVIATVLNGYETQSPFGRKARVAEFVVLSSTLPQGLSEQITETLRAAYHTHRIRFTADAPCAFTILRDVYPHERQFLTFDVAHAATEISLVREGLLTSIRSMPIGIGTPGHAHPSSIAAPLASVNGVHVEKVLSQAGKTAWIEGIGDTLRQIANEYALPRTLFIIADEDAREYLRRALDDASLRKLWLSDEPLTIVPVGPTQFTAFVKVGPEAEADVFLMMLALFHAKPIDALAA